MKLDQATGTFKLVASNFAAAGYDGWTQPPAQNPSLFQSLSNIMPVTRSIIERRWGYICWASGAPVFNRLALYQADDAGSVQKQVLGLSASAVTAYNENGSSYCQVFTPSAGCNAQGPFTLNSRNYNYFLDGIAADTIKWNGQTTDGTSNWGIVAPTTALTLPVAQAANAPSSAVTTGSPDGIVTSINASTGIATMTVNLQDTISATTSNSVTISGSDNVFANGTWAVASVVSPTEFTIEVPMTALPIQQIRVTAGNLPQPATVTFYQDHGLLVGDYITISGIDSGSPEELFNGTFEVTVVPSATTVEFSSPYSEPSDQYFVPVPNAYSIPSSLIVSEEGTVTIANPGITLTVGRNYFYCYQNQNTGHTSDLSPVSASTGPLSAQVQPVTGFVVSTDPQVDLVLLLATADGGDQTTLYEVTQIPNTDARLAFGFVDQIPEQLLLAQNVWQDTDSSGNLHGVAENTPPPTATGYLCEHQGRLFILDGPSLYFSKNLDDVTTSSALITGRWEEAWPGTYQMQISKGSDIGTGLFSNGNTLYIGTNRSVYQLIGTGPSDFQEPEVIFTEAGVLSQDAWTAVFRGGQLLGTVWVTPDLRIIQSDFSTYQNIGRPVQAILNSVNQSNLGAVRACYFGSAPYDLLLIGLPLASGFANTQWLVYDLNAGAWFPWTLAANTLGIVYNITQAGLPQLLFSDTAGGVNILSSSASTDMGTAIPYNFTFPWLSGGDPALRFALNEIEIETGDPSLTLTVNGASTTAAFASPNPVVSSAALSTSPWGTYKVYLCNKPCKDRWYQFAFSSAGSTDSSVMNYFSYEVVPFNRL